MIEDFYKNLSRNYDQSGSKRMCTISPVVHSLLEGL